MATNRRARRDEADREKNSDRIRRRASEWTLLFRMRGPVSGTPWCYIRRKDLDALEFRRTVALMLRD
jgi:hypothetical protein